MKPTPYRGSEEMQKVQQRLERLEEEARFREGEAERLKGLVLSLQETIEQLQDVMECGKNPAPIFLRWEEAEVEGRSARRARFDKYNLEVVNWPNAPGWTITDAKGNILDIGIDPCSFGLAVDDCEAALRRLIQSKQPPQPI